MGIKCKRYFFLNLCITWIPLQVNILYLENTLNSSESRYLGDTEKNVKVLVVYKI